MQPKNSHLILPSLFSVAPLCYHSLVKGEGKQSLLLSSHRITIFPAFLIEINRLGHYLQWTVPFLCHTQHNIHENSDGREGNPHYIRGRNAQPSAIHPLWRFAQPRSKAGAGISYRSDCRGDSDSSTARSLGSGALF